MEFNLSKNQLVENLSSFFLSPNYSQDIGKFILSLCSKYGVDVGIVLAFVIVILGCLYLLTHMSNIRPRPRPWPKAKSKSLDRTRSWIVREIHSGKPILDILKEDFNKARVNPATLANTEKVLEALLDEEHLDLIKLQQAVSKLEMSGREDCAVKILEEAVKKANGANKPHEAYEIEMLLVEMLIYEGKLENALNRKCLKDESLKDARRPLYKAIIHQMEGNTKRSREQVRKAKRCWEEFLNVRDPYFEGDSLSFVDQRRNSHSFGMFKENVKRLQRAIQEFVGRSG